MGSFRTRVETLKWHKAGSMTYSVIPTYGNAVADTNTMGILIKRDCMLVDVGLLFGSAQASANETITFTIRKLAVGIGLTGSASQYSLGSGTSVTTISVTSGGALSAKYYMNNTSLGNNVSLSAGDVLFLDAPNSAFWTVTDLYLHATIRY